MSIFSQSGLSVCKHFHPGQHCFLIQTCFSHPCSTDFIPDINNHQSVSASVPTYMVAASEMSFSGTFSRVCMFWVFVALFFPGFPAGFGQSFDISFLLLLQHVGPCKSPKYSYACLCPRPLNFHLWFLNLPPFWLQAGALIWPHPGQSQTHRNPFWVSACCLFSRAACGSEEFAFFLKLTWALPCFGLSKVCCWFPEGIRWFTPAGFYSVR